MSQKEREFSKLIKDNQGLVIKISRMYTNTAEDEEDLFQEIVLQLWRSYDTFKGDAKISTWMYRVALNTAITIFRKASRSVKTNELGDYQQVQALEESGEQDEKIVQLYNVIKKLPSIDKALIMMYLDDLPYKDISENLGISEVNARVKMSRLKKTLKDKMTDGTK